MLRSEFLTANKRSHSGQLYWAKSPEIQNQQDVERFWGNDSCDWGG